jgi:signal peptidase I
MKLWTGCFVLAVACFAAFLARRRFAVVEVHGLSMSPALRPGDRVLVRVSSPRRLRVGSVLVFQRPRMVNFGWDPRPRGMVPGRGDRWVIKRVAALPGDPVPDVVRYSAGEAAVVPDGMLVALSDNADGSLDSRHWGFIPYDQVLGHVVRALPRAPTRQAE